MQNRAGGRGFTIVELLIVVVVIAILAAITIVSYNGITKSAYNTQIMSGVRTYYDALSAYRAINGEYPKTQREVNGEEIAMTCLGKGYASQQCGEVTSVPVFEDSLFNSQMETFLKSSGGPVSSATLPVPGETFIGAVYGIDVTDASSTGRGRVIEYGVYGQNASCGIPGAWAYSASSTTTACELLLEEYPAY